MDEARCEIVVDGTLVVCRISRESIEDHLGNTDTWKYFDAVQQNRERIEDMLFDIYSSGRIETDGSLLLRSATWWGGGRVSFRLPAADWLEFAHC